MIDEAEKEYLISPSDGPFQFNAWLELPFNVAIRIDRTFETNYNPNSRTLLRMIIQSDVYRVVTGNRWTHSNEIETWSLDVKAGEKKPFPPIWKHEYVPARQLPDLIEKLATSVSTRYIHIDEVPALVHLVSSIPDDVVPKQDFDAFNLMPHGNFFVSEVLPNLRSVIDAYRIIALPWMRYSIMPVSESIVYQALIKFKNKDGHDLSFFHYGFDLKAPILGGGILGGFAKEFRMEARFEDAISRLSTLEAENQIASSYYLFHMRRWSEAVTIASAVVDRLLHDLIFKLASTEIEAEAIWLGFKYREIFNKVLPAFGKPKLSEDNQDLWQEFVNAKEYRGAKVHGDYPKPYDSHQQDLVKIHLRAFYRVARWLSEQLGHSWALDVPSKGDPLDAFP